MYLHIFVSILNQGIDFGYKLELLPLTLEDL